MAERRWGDGGAVGMASLVAGCSGSPGAFDIVASESEDVSEIKWIVQKSRARPLAIRYS